MDLPTEIPSAEIPSAEASSELSGAFRDVGAGDGSSSASSSAPPIHQPVAAVDVSSVEDEKLFVGQVSMLDPIPQS